MLAIALLASGCASESRRERVVDLVTRIDAAELSLHPEARPPNLVGDHPLNSDDDRMELVVSAGTVVRFRDVDVHAHARLAFAVGAPKTRLDWVKVPTRCALAFAHDDGRTTTLVDTTLEAADAGRRHEGVVDLSALAGSRGSLVLSVDSKTPGRTRVGWSRLRIESDGRPETAADRILSFSALHENLAARFGAAARESGAVELPVPGSAEMKVAIPAGAKLRFFPGAFCVGAPPTVEAAGGDSGSIRLRVCVDGRALRELVCPVNRRTENVLDHDEVVDLAEFAGREVALRFESEPTDRMPAGAVTATLALPRLLARREFPRARRGRGAPDLFFIVIDTLRADALGCYGNRRPTSPSLDAFARGSLLYENAWSPSSWTLPSTVSLLTGLHPDVHGAKDAASTFLLDSHETIAEKLAARGVTTGGFVANLLLSPAGNFDQGFETWQVLPHANARKLVPHVLEWLDDHEDDRLFAYVHFFDPHGSYDAPVPLAETFATPGNDFSDRTFKEILDYLGDEPERQVLAQPDSPNVKALVERCHDLYETEVRYFDRWFAAFIDGLRARGRLDDAVIVVTADHGEEFLEHGAIFHGDHVYAETVHVPFLVRAPGLTPGRVAEPFGTVETTPLLLDLLDADGPALDALARSRFPESIVMATDLATERGVDHLVSRAAILRGRYKLDVTPELSREELYDLAVDPGERHDLSEEQPRIRAVLSQLLRERREEYARSALREKVPVVPEIEAQMRALGYIR